MLLLDNHDSHLSLASVDLARANGIVLLNFPPHCSHRLQPLDVSVYSAFKNYYNVHCSNKIIIENPGVPVTIYNVAEIVGKAFPKAFTPTNIISGFRATGIWPFNREIFTESDFLCSSVTNRPYEESNDPKELSGQVLRAPPPDNPSCSHASSTGTNYLLSTVFTVNPGHTPPFPKALARKIKGGKKKGKTMVVTDTPNKKEIEAEARQKEKKKKLAEARKAKKISL